MDLVDEAFKFAEMTLKMNSTEDKVLKSSSDGKIYGLSVRISKKNKCGNFNNVGNFLFFIKD
jgi:hypothetical protein